MVFAVRWETSGRLVLLDQRLLPETVRYNEYTSYVEAAGAITDMVVRGAPAIGITGGYALALAAMEAKTRWGDDVEKAREFLNRAAELISRARPTAVNLKWAVQRVLGSTMAALESGVDEAIEGAIKEARAIEVEDYKMNLAMGEHGARLIEPGSRILTHCNAGALATGGYGTALGVIRKAFEQGKVLEVYADETRPYLQGARLTAWELAQDGIPVTVLVDSAAGYLISTGRVGCIIVGADRIARNGDVANKIGTYTLACLAKAHDVPFYVAAPTSTFDLSIETGDEIPVEQRSEEEVLSYRGVRVAPHNVKAFNPAFDITPAQLISAIITERGVIFPPIGENLPEIVAGDGNDARS